MCFSEAEKTRGWLNQILSQTAAAGPTVKHRPHLLEPELIEFLKALDCSTCLNQSRPTRRNAPCPAGLLSIVASDPRRAVPPRRRCRWPSREQLDKDCVRSSASHTTGSASLLTPASFTRKKPAHCAG